MTSIEYINKALPLIKENDSFTTEKECDDAKVMVTWGKPINFLKITIVYNDEVMSG